MSDIGLCDRSVCSARCNHPYRGEALIACSRFDGSWTLVQPCDAPLGVMSVTLSNPSRCGGPSGRGCGWRTGISVPPSVVQRTPCPPNTSVRTVFVF